MEALLTTDSFRNAIIDRVGYDPGSVIQDGLYHRFKTQKKHKLDGFYTIDHEGHGNFGNWNPEAKLNVVWIKDSFREMTDAEIREARARHKEAARKARELTANTQSVAAISASNVWEKGHPCIGHAYLEKKKIKPHGLRVDDFGNLLLPISSGGKIVNVQRISLSKKLFMKSAEKKGCYHEISGSPDVIFIAEGFATAASINEATGCLTIVALDAGNLLPVAKTIRKKYGETQTIIIAADNDQWTESGNTGIVCGQQAAKEIFASCLWPQFPNDDDAKRKDWNDYACLNGLEAVKAALMPEQKKITNLTIVSLNLDDSGKPKGTIENLKKICDNNNYVLRYNVIKKQEEILIPNEDFSLDNMQNASYGRLISSCREENMPVGNIKEYITNICDKNQFNPVVSWILSKPWDGTSRLDEFYNTVTSTDTELKNLIIQRWMVSAVAAAFSNNGISAHGVMVFKGEQNIGKTSWFKKLVPPEIEAIKDGYILRLDDKDSILQCVSHWMVELGELEATFRKSDIAQLKAFITSDRDILRQPYAPKKNSFPRRTVFFASVNHHDFLFDETGNRRFWVIDATHINYMHEIDMQQLWAEFYALYLDGEPWIMSGEEMKSININNKDFTGADYHDELVYRNLDWGQLEAFGEDYGSWKTATEITLMLGIQNPKQVDLNKISKSVRKHNGDKSKRTGDSRLLLVPNKI